MRERKASISKARSYAEIGEFWDEHDLSNFWKKTKKVKFEVVRDPEAWLQQKIKEQRSSRPTGKLSAKNA